MVCAPAACCFLRCLNVGLSGITMRSGGFPGIVGTLSQPTAKGELTLTHLLRADSPPPPLHGQAWSYPVRKTKQIQTVVVTFLFALTKYLTKAR